MSPELTLFTLGIAVVFGAVFWLMAKILNKDGE